MRRSVLITGASTGIGRAAALRLDRAGWRVFAGVRREEDAATLRGGASANLEPLLLDVTDADAIAAAAERIGEAAGGRLDGLVNNAGIAVPGPLETLPIEDFRRQLDVNLTAQVAVTQRMLPLLRAARGRLVFITSIGGLMAFPMFGAYHAAKFGLEGVGDVFRQELSPWDISVSIVEPGSIATPIWDRGQEEVDAVAERARPGHRELYGQAMEGFREVARRTGERGIPPERVAGRIEHALASERPRARYLVGTDARGQALLARLLPDRAVDWIVARATGS